MSPLPRQAPSHTAPPSSASHPRPAKPFVRQANAVSAAQQQQQQQQPHQSSSSSKGLPPSPLFEDPPHRTLTTATTATAAASHDDDDDPVMPTTEADTDAAAAATGTRTTMEVDFGGLVASPSGSASAPAPVPAAPAVVDFQPFFALVEDTVTREHFHPTVHYIFADDESDIITEAVCRSLEQRDDDDDAVVVGGSGGGVVGGGRAEGGGAAGESRYLPPPAAGVREHYVVLDVQPVSVVHRLSMDTTEAGRATTATATATATTTPNPNPIPTPTVATTTYKVAHAQSLSSEWQVLKTNISSAPTIGEQDGDEGLMLRIEGRGYTPADDAPHPPHAARAGDREQESVEDLIARFQRGLDDIRTVMLTARGPEPVGEDES